jgi:hypothetical protein
MERLRTCITCGRLFTATRAGERYCAAACKQAGYRQHRGERARQRAAEDVRRAALRVLAAAGGGATC